MGFSYLRLCLARFCLSCYTEGIINKGEPLMRLDKYLKVSRLIKRRTVAKDASDGARLNGNGKTAKPACDVKEGDVIEITFGNKTVKFEIMKISEHVTKDQAEEMYKVIL